MTRRYSYLAGRLRQLNMNCGDLAYALGISAMAVSNRMTCKTQWGIEEMYKVLDICRAQPEELHLYFPRDGRATA